VEQKLENIALGLKKDVWSVICPIDCISKVMTFCEHIVYTNHKFCYTANCTVECVLGKKL
jgi:hypothetical protein